MHHTSQVQTWQGSSAGWKLSPGPYTLPSNTQSAQKQSYKIIKQLGKTVKNAADVLNSYQHTQDSTPRARWWSWRRETDSVLQSTWSPRRHTCRSCRGWSLRTSCCPRYAPLLRTYNLREENSVTGKTVSTCDYSFQRCVYLCSEDSRLRDQSPDAYKAAWGTREAHTEPRLPVRLRQISTRTQGKELIWREKANGWFRPGKCRWSRGLNSGSMSARRWTPVHRAYTLMTRWQQVFMRAEVCACLLFQQSVETSDPSHITYLCTQDSIVLAW